MKCSATTDGKQCLPCELLLDLGRFNKNSRFKKVNITSLCISVGENNEILPVIVSNTNPEKYMSGVQKQAINMLFCESVRLWHHPQT